MILKDRYKLYGAALIEVLSHPKCKNVEVIGNRKRPPQWYKINDSIGLCFRSASEAGGFYLFGLDDQSFRDIEKIKSQIPETCLAMICTNVSRVCCVTSATVDLILAEWNKHINTPKKKSGKDRRYNLCVCVTSSGFRYGVDVIGWKNNNQLIPTRSCSFSDFPEKIFP